MAVSKAVQRRFDAVGLSVSTFLNEANGYKVENTTANREAYAKLVRDMASLGRTERWKANCEGAALTALDPQNDLNWCIRQYGIYMGYAAE